MKTALCHLIALIGCVYANGKAKWSYTEGTYGPKNWGDSYKECKGDRQSPIDIETGKLIRNSTLTEIVFEGYDTVLRNPYLENNGHTAKLTYNTSVSMPTISEGGLGSVFVFAQLHFHWGRSNGQGSEHTLDGVEYPLEMHLVHYNKKYGDLKNSLNYGDGLAVLGVFFQVGDYYSYINPIVLTLEKIKKKSDVKQEIMGDVILRDLLPRETTLYYRYEGSLTTPPCSPAVLWTVFGNIVSISEKQLRVFRQLMDDSGSELTGNYRPPQKLGSRKVQIFSRGSHRVDATLANIVPLMSIALLVVSMSSRHSAVSHHRL